MHAMEPETLVEKAPLACLYHENSKLTKASEQRLADAVAEFGSDPEALRRSMTAVKTYPSARRVLLPPRRRLPRPRRRLDKVLAERRSVRAYDGRPLPFAVLASLLEHAGGITAGIFLENGGTLAQPLRAWPSGGALYPIETYVVAAAVGGLEPGIYHHHPVDRCLEPVRSAQACSRLGGLILTATGRLDAPAVIILAGRWERPLTKYGERGYRVLLLDAGHLAQNLLLVAAALGLGACPVAGFHDDALAAELGLDPREEPVLHVMTAGYGALSEGED